MLKRVRNLLVWSCLLCALHACSRSEARSGPQPLADQPKDGGELVFAFDGAAVSKFVLDPQMSAFAPHHRVMRSIFDSLVVALPEHRFGSWLAKSWEVSEDGLEYTFHLRDDVRFHDGTRFDAQAVKRNLDRIKDPKNALLALADIGPYNETQVVDDFTARVRFSRPYAPFLANLSKSCLGIISPAALDKYGDEIGQHPVGTGPFRLKSITPATEIALERNPDYRWPAAESTHTGPARLQRLTFRNVPEEATRVAVLMNGQAGAVDLVPPQNLVQLQKSPEYHLIEGELLNQNYSLYLNVQREPWDDPRVREAFKLSLDIDAVVRTIYLGTQTRAWSPLSPSLLGYDPTLEGSWKLDRAAAARILDERGWKPGPDGVRVKNGKRLTVVFLDTQGNREKRLDVIAMLRRQLHDSGFELRIDSQASGPYLARSAAGDFDLLAGSLFAPDPDVLRRTHSPELRAATSVCKADDKELNALLDAGYTELDSARRSEIYAKAQHLIIDRTYSIPIYVLKYSVVSGQHVQGVAIDVHGFPVFYDAWVSA